MKACIFSSVFLALNLSLDLFSSFFIYIYTVWAGILLNISKLWKLFWVVFIRERSWFVFILKIET